MPLYEDLLSHYNNSTIIVLKYKQSNYRLKNYDWL